MRHSSRHLSLLFVKDLRRRFFRSLEHMFDLRLAPPPNHDNYHEKLVRSKLPHFSQYTNRSW